MSSREQNMMRRRSWLYLLVISLLLLILIPAAGLMAQEGTGVPTADSTIQKGEGDDQSVPGPSLVDVPAEVLIIQDALAWGVDIGPNILARYGISYEKITSVQLAAKDLSVYRMVILPSNQPEALYTIWNTQIGKIEAYAQAGGILWVSVEQFGTVLPQVPGGVTYSYDSSQYNDLAITSHPWVRGVPNPTIGSFLSHYSFANLRSGTTIVMTSQNSPFKPTLIDYAYGTGRVVATAQSLEYSWYNNINSGPILPNALINLLGYRVLIIQDQIGWGNNEQQKIFNRYRVKFNQVTSSRLNYVSNVDKMNLTAYDMVVSVGAQPEAYNTNWNNNFTAIANYVNGGGKLWQSATGLFVTTNPQIPGGVTLLPNTNPPPDESFDNSIAAPNHPWVRGVPNPTQGNHLSYNSFGNIYGGSTIIARSQNSPFRPTLIDYKYGSGRVSLTAQTIEYSKYYGYNSGPILENSLIDLLGAGTVFLPSISNNYTSPFFGPREYEPNDSPSTANGPLILGKNYIGSPDDKWPAEERDWFSFDYNGTGNITVDVTGFIPGAAQVLMFRDPDYGTVLDSQVNQPAPGNYQLFYNGSAGAGKYMIWLFAPVNHPKNHGDYTLKVTVN